MAELWKEVFLLIISITLAFQVISMFEPKVRNLEEFFNANAPTALLNDLTGLLQPFEGYNFKIKLTFGTPSWRLSYSPKLATLYYLGKNATKSTYLGEKAFTLKNGNEAKFERGGWTIIG